MSKSMRLLTLFFAAVGVASLLSFHFSVPELGGPRNLLPDAEKVTLLDADKVEGLLWSEATLQSHRPLNPSYSYPYAIPYGSNILLAPLVHFVGLKLISNQIGMFLFSLVILGVAFFFARSLSCDRQTAALGAAIVFLSFRSSLGANLLHHILFYQIGLVCGMGMFAVVFRAYRRGSLTTNMSLLLACFAAWSAANGGISIALGAMPVVIALAVVRCQDRDGSFRKVFWPCLGRVGVGFLIGLAAYLWAMRSIEETGYIDETGSFKFQNLDKCLESLSLLPKHWLTLFLTHKIGGVEIGTLEGVETTFSLVMAVIIAVLPLFFLFRYAKLSLCKQAVFIYGVSIWMLCLAQFVFFRGPLDRLLYSGLFANYIFLSVVVVEYRMSTLRHQWIAPSLSLLLALWCLYFTCTAIWKVDSALIDDLKERGFKQGCATFWKANGNTVLSGGQIRIAPIELKSSGYIAPDFFQSDQSWYWPRNPVDNCFLLLDNAEWTTMRGAANGMLFNLAKDYFTSCGYHVLVYSGPHWRKLFTGTIFAYNFNIKNWTRHCTFGSNKLVIHENGESRGPYISLDKNMRCNVHIRGKNLDNATIYASGVHEERIPLELVYTKKTDSEVWFSFTSEFDLERLDIVIRNRANKGDIVLYSEVLESSPQNDLQ